jgi:hypothetical protein
MHVYGLMGMYVGEVVRACIVCAHLALLKSWLVCARCSVSCAGFSVEGLGLAVEG